MLNYKLVLGDDGYLTLSRMAGIFLGQPFTYSTDFSSAVSASESPQPEPVGEAETQTGTGTGTESEIVAENGDSTDSPPT